MRPLRLGRGLGWRVLVPAAFTLAGLIFAASAQTARGTDLRGGERSDLVDLIRAETARVDAEVSRVEQLRDDVDRRSVASAGGDVRVSALLQRASSLEPGAHLTAVRGPALEVVLSDAPPTDPERLPEDIGPDDLVVHQQDLQAVVNAMWAGGAEAIRLMDQRIISTSAVRCVGNVLILQGKTYPPPYRVTAVGDVDGMSKALEESAYLDTYRFFVEYVGLGYEQRATGVVTLPAYEGTLDLAFARTPAGG